MTFDYTTSLEEERAWLTAYDDNRDELFSVDVIGIKLHTAWKYTERVINYRVFCEHAKIARANYYRELRKRSQENAHRYASFWAGTRGKSYGHFRREYGA